MKDATAKLLEKAGRAIAAGESSLRDGHIEAAVGRAYYAMFHVAQGLLNEHDLRFRKHGGVHSAFGAHLVKTGEFDPRYHRQILAAFNKRIAADYGVEIELTSSEVEEMLAQARDFLDAAHRFLELRP